MDEKRYLQLNDIEAYKIAFHLSNYVWDIVVLWDYFSRNTWDYFSRNTVGEQFVTAVDSISANISERFGRFFKKDRIKFYRYSAGSVKECHDWAAKSKHRKLITQEQYDEIFSKLQVLPLKINSLIKYTNEKLQQ